MPRSPTPHDSGPSPSGCGKDSINRPAWPSQIKRSELQRWLDTLTPTGRLIVLLHWGDGLSAREIGEVLGLTTGTVARQLDVFRCHARAILNARQRSPMNPPDEAAIAAETDRVRDETRRQWNPADRPDGGPRAVFTTGEVARICGVSTRTANKWVDGGVLTGYRIPMSQHRRVTRLNLLKFLHRHGIPSRAPDLIGGAEPPPRA